MSTKSIKELKSKLIQQISYNTNSQLSDLQKEADDLKKGIAEDSKSSAGDKFETSRERANQSLGQIEIQIQKKKELLNYLKSDDFLSSKDKVEAGCLIHSNKGYLFALANIPSMQIEEHKINIISPSSPLFSALRGKKNKEKINFRMQEIEILAIA